MNTRIIALHAAQYTDGSSTIRQRIAAEEELAALKKGLADGERFIDRFVYRYGCLTHSSQWFR